MLDRYSRQILFPEIGKEGQRKLSNSTVVIIGCGALGSIIATSLVRAGIGKVRIIDRDFIEYHNLQRQLLFDEDDIRNELPKAIAAEKHLKKVNSSIDIKGIVADVNFTNIERLVKGADVILDGLDNYETRFLINDVSLKHNIPWIYGGAIASLGMMKVIVPHETSCFRCLIEDLPPTGTIMTCDTAGVISPAPFIVGSLQTVETLKLLIGSNEVNKDLTVVDVWAVKFDRLSFMPRKDCPACQGEYDFLKGKFEVIATTLCGQNAVQILNPRLEKLSFAELEKRLKPLGRVSHNEFMLRFTIDEHEMVIFPDGRAIVKNTDKESQARALYSKYIGA
jgi:adenylyltransferase/sulfurtransferase